MCSNLNTMWFGIWVCNIDTHTVRPLFFSFDGIYREDQKETDYFLVPWDVFLNEWEWIRNRDNNRECGCVTDMWCCLPLQWMRVTLTTFGGSTSVMLDIYGVFMDRYVKEELSLNDIWTNELLLSWSSEYGHHWHLNWM